MWIPETPAGRRTQTDDSALSFKNWEAPVQGWEAFAGDMSARRDGALPDTRRGRGRIRRGAVTGLDLSSGGIR